VSRSSDDIRTTLSGEKSVSSLGLQRAVNKKGCQDSEMSRAHRIKRSGIISEGCPEEETSKRERVPRADAVNGREPGTPFSL
jgi:hypothetical protein